MVTAGGLSKSMSDSMYQKKQEEGAKKKKQDDSVRDTKTTVTIPYVSGFRSPEPGVPSSWWRDSHEASRDPQEDVGAP